MKGAYQKGDIVIVPVPFTDNRNFKERPALVVSNDAVHRTGDIMVVQITSKFKKDGLSVSIYAGDVTGPLPKKSYVRCHKVFVLESSLIIEKVSALKPHKYREVIDKLHRIIK